MSVKFVYDVTTLIELVEERPCLWDKFSGVYKDKIKKSNAWKEVCAFLDKDFEKWDTEKQRKIGDVISTKWQNVRDAFVRSLKKKSGQSMQRKYLYHDQHLFLLKIVNKDQTESSISDTEVASTEISEDVDNGDRAVTTESIPSSSRDSSLIHRISRKRPNSKHDSDPIEAEILKKLKESSPPPDEDESFFMSITPAVRELSGDEKLEFRMGVLQLLQKLKQKRHFGMLKSIDSPGCSSSSAFSEDAFSQDAPLSINPFTPTTRTYPSYYSREQDQYTNL